MHFQSVERHSISTKIMDLNIDGLQSGSTRDIIPMRVQDCAMVVAIRY